MDGTDQPAADPQAADESVEEGPVDRWGGCRNHGVGLLPAPDVNKDGEPWPRIAPEPPEQDEGAADTIPDAQRLTILVTHEECAVNDQALVALANEPEVYHRNRMLVRVLRAEAGQRGCMKREAGAPVIHLMGKPRLRELLSRCACFMERRGENSLTAIHPPGWCVDALLDRADYPDLRYLAGVVECPTLRPDGSILDRPGWDPVTGLVYAPSGDFPSIPEPPTRADAARAADLLLDVVCDFPFVAESHKYAWLAGVLTAIARAAIDGPCPLFLFEASAQGSGKTLLADLVSWIVAGRTMPRSEVSDDNEEVRKTITAIALEGERLVLLDNAAEDFGCKALDSALTSRTWQGRILGRSERTRPMELDAVFFVSGNNLRLRGDMHRRVIPCRIEPETETPETRSDFKHPDLIQHVREHRAELVVAALTMLRAHALAGRPSRLGVAPLGSYRDWCNVIRECCWWAKEVDLLDARASIQPEDKGTSDLGEFFAGWAELPEGTGNGMTVKDALALLAPPGVGQPDRHKRLRDVVTAWSRKVGELPSARLLGAKLKAARGKVAGGLKLVSLSARSNYTAWKIEPIKKPGTTANAGTQPAKESGESGESGESVSNPFTRERSDTTLVDNTTPIIPGGQETNQTHLTHQEEEF